ncbi:hypothetical protein KY332_00040 [Candidatus Woesearchaeota archaeon]|nr:hypothetical protein [Candidatus Woesearchaeota archaeon]
MIQKIKQGTAEFKRRVRQRTLTAVTAAFAFIIALVWKDAIRKVIDAFVARLKVPETAYLHEFIIAILLTVVCVIAIMLFSKLEVKEEEK